MIEPASGLSSPTRVLRKTDLPVPEGPSITEISPAGRVRETSFQITCDPKRLVRPSTLISTPTAHLVVMSTPATDGRPRFRRLNEARRPKLRPGMPRRSFRRTPRSQLSGLAEVTKPESWDLGCHRPTGHAEAGPTVRSDPLRSSAGAPGGAQIT